ncbi:MAG: ABC transporter ATP-binding protein [Beijerinckiaceae bacterium]|nr:ABC transporter ATP-binding protein [Beijerinckiaceae bacterium]
MTAPLIEVDALVKRYGAVRAVDDVSFHIDSGEFFALLGPSGCGKTTLMRLIAGFETPDAGRILIDGRDIAMQPPHRRPVNMMFQSYALFPHMSVEKNIGFSLRRQGMAAGEMAERVREMLRLVQLEGLGARRPDQLSGGQKARVALARALAARPRLLLLDEPLSALDRKLREETQFELMQVQRDLGIAFLVVTHDQDEAMAMAQRIALMREGRIEQIGAAREIYERPVSRWAASFIGDANLVDAQVREVIEDGSGEGRVRRTICDASGATLVTHERVEQGAGPAPAVGSHVSIAVRAERIAISDVAPADRNVLEGEIAEGAYLGGVSTWRVTCREGLTMRVSRMSADGQAFTRGQRVYLTWPPEAARVLTR